MRTTATLLILSLTTPSLVAQTSCDSLNTLYANNYINHGAMFDVVPTATLTLDHINANINWGAATYSLYYRYGSFMGHETAPADWTLLGTTSITSNNTQTISDLPTVIPIDINLPMVLGDTIALYLTASPLSKVFLTGTTIPWGTAYASDAYLSVSVSRGVYQLFGTPSGISHIWNGSVSYCGDLGAGYLEVGSAPHATVTNSGSELVVDITRSTSTDGLGVCLTDLTGRTVLCRNASAGRTSLSIDQLASGTYIVTVTDKGTTILSQKMLIP